MEDATVAVRRATAVDDVLLAELGARTFEESFAAQNAPENMAMYLSGAFAPEKQAAELADPSSVLLIAEVEGVAVGYAKLRAGEPAACVAGPAPVQLARIYSVRAHLGRGVGPALLQACIDEARRGGHETLWLGVWEHNLRARAFYRKRGFVEVGTQVFPLGRDLQNDVVMQRALGA